MNAEQLVFATKGNADAARFLELITSVLHFWDDLIDRDHALTDEQINRAMWLALVELPRNAFYLVNFAALNPMLVVAIQNWHVANALEATESRDDKHIAFIIRSSYCDLVILTATLCGGQEHGQAVAQQVRKFWHDETFEGYLSNLSKQFEDAKLLKET